MKGAESSPTPGQGTVSTRLTKGACLDKQIGRAQTRTQQLLQGRLHASQQLQGRLHASQQLPRPGWAVAMIVHAARVAVFNTFLVLTLVLFFAPWFRQVPLGRFCLVVRRTLTIRSLALSIALGLTIYETHAFFPYSNAGTATIMNYESLSQDPSTSLSETW